VPTLPSDAAVRLFDERARAVAPSFGITGENAAAVTEICRRLDGLPLAIELAAARVTALTPAQIAARLDDCFRLLGGARRGMLPRQQTLRATIDWSYALLEPAERELLARLSVFAGGCTLAAAEAVCAGGDLETGDVLTHLCSLVDRSLVLAETVGTETRYRLLATVRQYAAERLDRGESDVVRRRHAEYFAVRAEDAGTARLTPRRDEAQIALRRDLDNIRAALRWSAERNDELFVRLAFGHGWCYFPWGLWWEGRDWLERALSLPAGAPREAPRARALFELAYMVNHQLDFARALPAIEECISIWDELGDVRERGHAGLARAHSYLFEGSASAVEMALEIAVEADRTLRAAEDWLGVCWAAGTLGGVYAARGDIGPAMAAYDEARQLAHRVGQLTSVGIGCMGVASLAIATGDLARGAALLREGLAAHRKAPDFMFLAWTIECTAMYAAASGGLAEATRLLGADQMLRRRGGAIISIETTHPETYAQIVQAARAALGDAAFEATLEEGRRLDVEGAIALAESVVAVEQEDRPGAGSPAIRGPALRVVSLGPVRVERHGVPVPLAEWKYAKARELLFLLLLHPEGRTREQIGLALWPDVSTEQLRTNLHPVLHHLRRVLGGAEWVMHDGGVYRFDRTRDYSFDVEEMDRLIVEAASAKDDREAAAVALARATALYEGDFLEQDPPAGDWHLDRQGTVRRRYLEALSALGATHMAAGRWRDAEDAWRQLIARDDLNEAAYRNLMECYERMGDRREALRVFERLTAVLREELDDEPGPETVAIAERLQGGAAGARAPL
jgi:DNA-binding SARP family transcriptional activator